MTPTGSLPRPGSRPLGATPTPVTNTSLKATPQPSRAFGSGHNNVAKPFGYVSELCLFFWYVLLKCLPLSLTVQLVICCGLSLLWMQIPKCVPHAGISPSLEVIASPEITTSVGTVLALYRLCDVQE